MSQIPHSLAVIVLVLAVLCDASTPTDILDLSAWRLQLPRSHKKGSIDWVETDKLVQGYSDEWFQTNVDGDAVAMKADCGGAVTHGTQYPRCELREMAAFQVDASWDINDDVEHSLYGRQTIVHVPEHKSEVVIAQIHGAKRAVIDLRLSRLEWIEVVHEGTHYKLDRDYKIGDMIQWRLAASDGMISIWYNDMSGEPALQIPSEREGNYFKVGTYTQSNEAHGDLPDDFAEVWLYALELNTPMDHSRPTIEEPTSAGTLLTTTAVATVAMILAAAMYS